MKKRKILNVVLVCLAVAITAIAGYSFGMRHKDSDAEILSDMVDVAKTNTPDNLLVVDSTALYATRTLQDMAAISANIVIAEVVEIGETTAKFSPSDWPDVVEPKEGRICIEPLQTAVTLEVKKSIKGADVGDKIIFYQDGGVTAEYIQRTNGLDLEEGMEILLFLTEDGYSYGGQGEFLVFDDAVVIPKAPRMRNYLDEEKLFTIQTQSLMSDYKDRVSSQSITMMETDDFAEAIRLLFN